MKNCPNCNTSVNDTAKFCRKCGFNIKKYEEENQSEPMFCDECGAKIPTGSAFCEECGFKLENDGTSIAMTSGGFDFGSLGGLSTVATEQLYEQNGLKVENGVLVEYKGKKRNISIPGTIEEIFDKVFENNEFVTSVKIEEGVQVIGKRAFANCSSLVEISIPSSCKQIYADAFENTNIELLCLSEIDLDFVKRMLSCTVINNISNEDIKNCSKKTDNKVTVDILAIKKKADANFQKKLDSYNVGKTINFGSYYQKNKTIKEPIEWLILKREGNNALLISKRALNSMAYIENTGALAVWEYSQVRKWLNNEFLNDAFNSKEKEMVMVTYLKDEYSTIGNKIFVLDLDELNEHFKSNKERKCTPTPYAKANGGYEEDKGCYYWLRFSFKNVFACHFIDYFGNEETYSDSNFEILTDICVRPAMWVDINKIVNEI